MPLSKYREEINQIDQDLVRLLDRRAEIARLVGISKADTGRSTFDPARQKAVINRALTRSQGIFPRESLSHIFRNIVSTCLALQRPLTVGFLGPVATYSNQAAVVEFGSNVDFEAHDRIQDIFTAVDNGWIDYGVVPVENSTGGIIHETLDSFFVHEARICSEILLPIHHNLMANCPMEDVKRIYSHPQAFQQCQLWLDEHLPGVERIEIASTAKSAERAERAAQEESAAAIGSEIAAELYELTILARGIEDMEDNTTRFLVIAKEDSAPSGDDKTSLMFCGKARDRAGMLYYLLKPFADAEINMTKIESRPSRRRAWDYVFFVDVFGHRLDEGLKKAISEMEENCQMLRVLGSYPREKTPREIERLRDLTAPPEETGEE